MNIFNKFFFFVLQILLVNASFAGPYALEGLKQEDPLQKEYGLRADVDAKNPEILGIEDSRPVRVALEKCSSFLPTSDSPDNAGFNLTTLNEWGDNVYYKSTLIKQAISDVRRLRFAASEKMEAADEKAGASTPHVLSLGAGADTSTRSPLFLDAGAGLGFNTTLLLDEGATVIAVDLSTKQLAATKQRHDPGVRKRLYLNDTSILDLEFSQKAFLDGIVVSHVFHYLTPNEIKTVLAKFARWLKPTGRLYMQGFNVNMGAFAWYEPVYRKRLELGQAWPGYIGNFQVKATQLCLFAGTDQDLCDIYEGFTGWINMLEYSDLMKAFVDAGFHVISSEFRKFRQPDDISYFPDELAFIAQPVSRDTEYTSLMSAVLHRDKRLFDNELKARVNVNSQTSTGATALHLTTEVREPLFARKLLEHRADPNLKDAQGRTALYLAARNGYSDVVQELLRGRADPNSRTKDGKTILSAALNMGHSYVIELLLKAGAVPTEEERAEIQELNRQKVDPNSFNEYFSQSVNELTSLMSESQKRTREFRDTLTGVLFGAEDGADYLDTSPDKPLFYRMQNKDTLKALVAE